MTKCVAILLLLSFFLGFISTYPRAEGQYKVTLLVLRNCSAKEVINPHKDYGTFLQWHAGIFNSSGKTYVRGNYTVLKPSQNLKVRVRSFFWEDNRWKLRVRIPGFGCHREIVRILLRALKLNIDTNKCSLKLAPPMTVNRFDYNMVMHALELETEYGLWLWTFEVTSSSKSLVCFAVESLFAPKKTTP